MTVIVSSNYSGPSFSRGDADGDQFVRETMLDSLAEAMDNHDHAANKGLAVSRIAAGATVGAGAVLTTPTLVTPTVNTGGTYNGEQVFNDRLRFTEGASVASAGSIALGDDGNAFVITGMATITTITAKAQGTVVFLRFAAAAQLAPGGNLVGLPGKFCAQANAVCSLYSDGTNWLYLGGNGNKDFSVHVKRSTDLTGLASGSPVALTWDAGDWNNGPIWAVGAPTRLTPGVAGLYRLQGALSFTAYASGSNPNIIVDLYKGGSLFQFLHTDGLDATGTTAFAPVVPVSAVVLLGAAEYVELDATFNSVSTRTLKAGSHVTLAWAGYA